MTPPTTQRLPGRAAGVLMLALGLGLVATPPRARAADPEQLMRLLERRHCPGCNLQDADLVQADLREARLASAQLQRANLSGSRLEGADLRGTNLSFTSLAGADLRGADLRGANLRGTDLREADLSGARLSPGGLGLSHWQEAHGVDPDLLSYAELHNAGVQAARAGRHREAERFLDTALRRQPDAAISWVARGLIRAEQGNTLAAAEDLRQGSRLYRALGDLTRATDLNQAADQLLAASETPSKASGGTAAALAGGAMGALRILAPLALKMLAPALF